MDDVTPLQDAIASQAGDYAVNNYGMHLPHDRRMKLWRRHYDGALASLIAYQEILDAQRIRRIACPSLN